MEVAAFTGVAVETYELSPILLTSNDPDYVPDTSVTGRGQVSWNGVFEWLEEIDEEGDLASNNLDAESYQAAMNGLSSVLSIENNFEQQSTSAYYISRPLGFESAESYASHNFVVTDAEYLGDRNALVHSFGQTANGKVGRVSENTIGFSEGTYAADMEAWLSLSPESVQEDVYSMRIPVTSDRVKQYAFSIIADQDYAAFAGMFGANSNSAAQAIVNAASGYYIRPPDGERTSPGHKDYDEINFVIPVEPI